MDEWFGKFDISFVGARINCDTPDKIHAVHRFLKDESDSPYLDLLGAQDSQEWANRVWYNTTYFHESRHVHDYLLFPCLNSEYYHRLQAVFTTVGTLEIGSFNRYNVLPIPLSRWFQLERASQLELLKEWSDDDLTAVAPLYTSPRNSLSGSKDASHHLDGLDIYTKGLVWGNAFYLRSNALRSSSSVDQFGRTITITSLLEASAVAAQAYAAESLYGSAGIGPLMETIRNAQLYENNPERRYSEYSTVFSRVYNYLFYHKTIDVYYFIPFVSILMSWCFSGNIYEKGSYHPIHRFRSFINNDFGKGLSFQDIVQDPKGIFERWDRQYGYKPLNMAEYNLKQRALYEQLYQKCKQFGNEDVAAYVEMIAKASQRMVLVYMDNPLNYILPNKYLDHFRWFSNVPICFSIKKGIEDFSDLELSDGGSINEPEEYIGKDHFMLTINLPRIKLKIGERAERCQHAELIPAISERFERFGKLTDAIFEDAPDGFDYEIINNIISPKEIRFVY